MYACMHIMFVCIHKYVCLHNIHIYTHTVFSLSASPTVWSRVTRECM